MKLSIALSLVPRELLNGSTWVCVGFHKTLSTGIDGPNPKPSPAQPAAQRALDEARRAREITRRPLPANARRRPRRARSRPATATGKSRALMRTFRALRSGRCGNRSVLLGPPHRAATEQAMTSWTTSTSAGARVDHVSFQGAPLVRWFQIIVVIRSPQCGRRRECRSRP